MSASYEEICQEIYEDQFDREVQVTMHTSNQNVFTCKSASEIFRNSPFRPLYILVGFQHYSLLSFKSNAQRL